MGSSSPASSQTSGQCGKRGRTVRQCKCCNICRKVNLWWWGGSTATPPLMPSCPRWTSIPTSCFSGSFRLLSQLWLTRKKKPRVMRLSPAGLEVVAACGEHGAGFHEHSLSNEEMVVDVPYFIHHHAKLSKLAFFDNNSFKEILGKNNTILTIKRHYIQKFLQPPWGRFSHNQSLVFIKTLIK